MTCPFCRQGIAGYRCLDPQAAESEALRVANDAAQRAAAVRAGAAPQATLSTAPPRAALPPLAPMAPARHRDRTVVALDAWECGQCGWQNFAAQPAKCLNQ